MDDAKEVVKILDKLDIVKGISPGIIVPKNSISGSRSIKIALSNPNNLQMVELTVCSKIYTQKINIVLKKPMDNSIDILKNALKDYVKKYNINLK